MSLFLSCFESFILIEYMYHKVFTVDPYYLWILDLWSSLFVTRKSVLWVLSPASPEQWKLESADACSQLRFNVAILCLLTSAWVLHAVIFLFFSIFVLFGDFCCLKWPPHIRLKFSIVPKSRKAMTCLMEMYMWDKVFQRWVIELLTVSSMWCIYRLIKLYKQKHITWIYVLNRWQKTWAEALGMLTILPRSSGSLHVW